MDFKTFLIKRVLTSFFVAVTCVCAGMAVTGMLFDPDMRFGYEGLLSPLILGAATMPPLLVGYSKHELSVREALVRKIIQLILIELIVVFLVYWSGGLESVSIAVPIILTIIIYMSVNLVIWVNDKRTAKEFNEALLKMQQKIEGFRTI